MEFKWFTFVCGHVVSTPQLWLLHDDVIRLLYLVTGSPTSPVLLSVSVGVTAVRGNDGLHLTSWGSANTQDSIGPVQHRHATEAAKLSGASFCTVLSVFLNDLGH